MSGGVVAVRKTSDGVFSFPVMVRGWSQRVLLLIRRTLFLKPLVASVKIVAGLVGMAKEVGIARRMLV